MGKIVILEGPDCTGKTTFARMLEKDYGYVYHHEGVPDPSWDLNERFGGQLMSAIESKENHVFDRMFIGEWVYGPRHRGHSQINVYHYAEIFGDLIWVVLFNTDWETQLATWRSRRDSEWTQDEEILRKDYERWLKVPKLLDVIEFDYAKQTYDWLLAEIGETVKSKQ